MPIYTRTGDQGSTSLLDGQRVPKNAAVLEVHGALDELNAAIGLALAHIQPGALEPVARVLLLLQQQLFVVGSALTSATHNTSDLAALVATLEGWIDDIDAQLPPLKSFILPGGTAVAAQLHVARTVARRAERALAAYAIAQAVPPGLFAYFNRSSDLLFVLARYANYCVGQPETTWQPRSKRDTI